MQSQMWQMEHLKQDMLTWNFYNVIENVKTSDNLIGADDVCWKKKTSDGWMRNCDEMPPICFALNWYTEAVVWDRKTMFTNLEFTEF